MSIPPIGSVITLECRGDAPGGPRFLDGRTMDGTVGLTANSEASGTRWAVTMHAGDVVTLKCMGDVKGPRFLDGRTMDGTVGLVPDTKPENSGTRWHISEGPGEVVTLRCLGLVDGNRYLDGRTMNGTVGLAPDTGRSFSGTAWRFRITGKLVMIFCSGGDNGAARFLHGRTNGGRRVQMLHTTAYQFSGSRWYMIWDNGGFRLKCVGDGYGDGEGEGNGPWYLDGNTVNGAVRLAPRTDPPFTGTLWAFSPSTGKNVALKCVGAQEAGLHYLNCRVDNTVELVSRPNVSPRGTRWRILEPGLPSETQVTDARGPFTVRVAQLTGEKDAENRPVLNETRMDWGARGMDLGANCEHTESPEHAEHPSSRLYIFLSDVITSGIRGRVPKDNTDLVAWLDAASLGGHEAEGLNFALPLEQHLPAHLQGEHEWRYCRNCSALFYDGEDGKGVCPAGDDYIQDGGHIPDGYRFVIPFETTNVSGQREWRRCTRCQIMFFELYADRGVCPAGGRHTGGGNRFILPHDSADTGYQENWRFCKWCRGLFFNGYPDVHGACIAGGTAFTLQPVKNGRFFDPFTVDGTIGKTLQAETPTGAFSYDRQIYVFIWIGGDDDQRPAGSYLVSKDDPGIAGPYEERFLFSDFRAWWIAREQNAVTAPRQFWQVAPWVVKNVEIPDLPSTDGDGLLMFGQGWHSDSQDAVHLAWMPLRSRREVQQFRGRPRGRSGPQKREDIRYRTVTGWSSNPADAKALFTMSPHYTSVSVAWLEGPRRWLLLYSKACGDQMWQRYNPTGSVVARIGTTPWDWPKENEVEIFNPGRDGAYGSYMHWHGLDTIFQNVPPGPPLDDQPGWSYGAFLLNRFTKWHPKTRMLDIYYLLSLARPYQTQVMFTKMHVP